MGVPIPGTDLVALAISAQSAPMSSSATRTVVPSSITSVVLLPARARQGASILNDSTANLFVAFGTAGTVTDFSVKILPGAVYPLPLAYTGVINGVWDAVNGQARITEFVS